LPTPLAIRFAAIPVTATSATKIAAARSLRFVVAIEGVTRPETALTIPTLSVPTPLVATLLGSTLPVFTLSTLLVSTRPIPTLPIPTLLVTTLLVTTLFAPRTAPAATEFAIIVRAASKAVGLFLELIVFRPAVFGAVVPRLRPATTAIAIVVVPIA
jgi:hypothetical protein